MPFFQINLPEPLRQFPGKIEHERLLVIPAVIDINLFLLQFVEIGILGSSGSPLSGRFSERADTLRDGEPRPFVQDLVGLLVTFAGIIAGGSIRE